MSHPKCRRSLRLAAAGGVFAAAFAAAIIMPAAAAEYGQQAAEVT